jgi:hypothetical protein
MTNITVENDRGGDHWSWCCNHLTIGTWKMMIGIMGTSATFCFNNEEDATAFKLVFGL